jgi:hypothetical protein
MPSDNRASRTTNGRRVRVEVVTTSGRGAALEFRVRSDTVELWHREHLAAVFDRDVLGAWLREPGNPMVVDEATLTVDRQVDCDGRVAVSLPEVNAWVLSPAEEDALCRRVAEPEQRPTHCGLSARQLDMLRFLAGQRDEPPRGPVIAVLGSLRSSRHGPPDYVRRVG